MERAVLSAVKRVLAEAAIQGYISRDIADTFGDVKGVKVKAMKERTKQTARRRITSADMRRLCEAPNGESLSALRDRALLLTLASSGCRISEVVTLTAPQIHAKGKGFVLTVMGKNQEEEREDIRKAQKALGHKSIETTVRHYVLDELEPGMMDGLF
jgi:integrase/recombinase XerD